jgi:hypothetical protein
MTASATYNLATIAANVMKLFHCYARLSITDSQATLIRLSIRIQISDRFMATHALKPSWRTLSSVPRTLRAETKRSGISVFVWFVPRFFSFVNFGFFP